MSPPFEPPDPEALGRALQFLDRPLSREEFDAYLASELMEDERAEKRSLIEWFIRRYPTPAERLAYARRYQMSVRRQRHQR